MKQTNLKEVDCQETLVSYTAEVFNAKQDPGMYENPEEVFI